MGFKLDDIWKEPVYPKKGVFNNLCSSTYYWREISEMALNEINKCLNEEKPCEIVVANLSILFWVFKGVNYNYGGLKSLSRREVGLMDMCEKYAPLGLITYADSVRTVLEQYQDYLFPKLKEKSPSNYEKIEVIYYKLLLLIYDLILSAIAFETKGDIWTRKDGYTISGDGYGNYSVKEKERTYDTLHFSVQHPSDILGMDKFQAYMKGRPLIAESVSNIDSTYPFASNTWLYFKTDINELRGNIYPVYETVIEDQTNEDKRLSIKLTSKIRKMWLGFLEIYLCLTFMAFFPERVEKMVEDKGYKVGKLRTEENAYRQTIYLNKH